MNYTKCWLNYHKINHYNYTAIKLYQNCTGIILENGIGELKEAFYEFYHREIICFDSNAIDGIKGDIVCNTASGIDSTSGSVSNNMTNCMEASASIQLEVCHDMDLNEEGYEITVVTGKTLITAKSEVGILYGIYSLLRQIQAQRVEDYDRFNYKERKEPSNPLRMLNQWDNMDGSIERGYSGNSFFFENSEILLDTNYDRIVFYARMVASIGINGVAINNVNVKGSATELISSRYYKKLKTLCDIFHSYGIRLFLSINFAAPIELGGLDTSDPCDESVIEWWMVKSKEVYDHIPELGGYLVKADSEGRPGPFTYERTHADGANMLANSIKAYDGLVIWRCFVYNCKQDWRDKETDRARAGYDNFMPIDGHFSDNVILQIKNGPMDFQVREPISPLFGGLKNTNMMLEVQIAQEYTGQQRHVCYLIPWFKEILEVNTYCNKDHGRVADIISGRTYNNHNCGMVAVTNTGNDKNWTGHDLAAANLYGLGRLSFDTSLSSEDIAMEWITLTFGYEEKVKENILKILMMSWPAYEKYTSPLGIGWMVKPNHHYGPDVDGYEYDRWGTYHRADHKGIGVDRTENGTGYCKQYNEPWASIYASIETCPEELLLFFHHVDYTHILSSGRTVIQHIYDTHFEGSVEAKLFLNLWMELQGHLDEDVYLRGVERFTHQMEHAKEWCDVINSYFYRKTGIKDRLGRELY